MSDPRNPYVEAAGVATTPGAPGPHEASGLTDDLGPSKVIEIHDRRAGLRAVVVIDNVACGPAIGGVRLAADAEREECIRLARAMTLKNAAAGLPYGGGKAIIAADPHAPMEQRERLVRAFAHAIQDLREYIPGPDIGTDETAMAWVADEIGRAVGLPRELGGIPLDEIGATGLGVCVATEVACARVGMPLEGARVVVQGFGAVGRNAARFLADRGAVLVAAADSAGTVYDPAGIDVAALTAHKASGRPLSDYRPGTALARDDIVGVDCDVWIPAARPDALHAGNVDLVRARVIIEAANIPTTPEAQAAMHARGILVIPDFIASAGGVIAACEEYRGGTEATALATVRERVRANTRSVLTEAGGAPPREAAMRLAHARIRTAMSVRRFA
jgi:glutamate dehydrogenase (NAD(P)+)